MPTFSVIIPTYNRCAYLKATLASVWRQAFGDYEVIVVDDGSTDETVSYLSSLGDRGAVVTQLNLGPGIARNKGAENARGEYLAFLDSDDLWFPWTLATVAGAIDEHDQPALVAASLISFRNERDLDVAQPSQPRLEFFRDYLSSSDRDCFVGAGMTFVRRDKFLEVGGFTGRAMNLEDHDLILRLGTAAGFVQIVSPLTLGWRRHDATLSDQRQRSFAGCRYLIENEQRDSYPGGKGRARARRKIITRHIRPWAVTFAGAGDWQRAWSLYSSTFAWNLSLRRWRFLMGFWSSSHESVSVAHSSR